MKSSGGFLTAAKIAFLFWLANLFCHCRRIFLPEMPAVGEQRLPGLFFSAIAAVFLHLSLFCFTFGKTGAPAPEFPLLR
ncbi:MAG: hypothetical protein J5I98_05860 [Phaeodactylibacter sp.]|nr:hypothetical protein [Phaeodactylibacter sp.]